MTFISGHSATFSSHCTVTIRLVLGGDDKRGRDELRLWQGWPGKCRWAGERWGFETLPQNGLQTLVIDTG